MTQVSALQWQNITQDDWHALGVYQSFYQYLLIKLAQGINSESQLVASVQTELKEGEYTLFSLTAHEVVEQLIESRYCYRQDELLVLNPRWYQKVLQQLDLEPDEILNELQTSTQTTESMSGETLNHTDDQSSIHDLDSTTTTSHSPEAHHTSTTSSDHEELSTPYLDPLSLVSEDRESLFTTLRVEKILHVLDGLTLLEKQLLDLIDLSESELDQVIQLMEKYELVKRQSPFIKLNVHGNKLVRLSRSEKQSALSRLTARMRKEYHAQ